MIEVELLNYRKDGSSFWNDLAISAITDDAGELVYYFGSQRDITARRRAQELELSERLLLMEVDHRAMNALALVQSFVSVSRADTAIGFASAVRGRVQALARAHRLLGESAWTGVDLANLLASEIPEALKTRVTTSSTGIVIPAALVQPVALVLHELMSNALVHGRLGDRMGDLSVVWTFVEGRLRFSWVETGVQSLAERWPEGVGLRLVQQVVNHQLEGSLVLEWRDLGLRAELEIPLTGTSDSEIGRPSN